ncbi:hypothetical protein K1719_019681 [Acacia pycnantha]|nr:hypothetical protein K1719_019681 [Acacia pycnantha]
MIIYETCNSRSRRPQTWHGSTCHRSSKKDKEDRKKKKISELTRALKEVVPQVKGNEYEKMYLVSLGTGFQKRDEEVRARRKIGQKVVENPLETEVYDAKSAEKWGLLAWGASPITEFSLDGSQDMVDYYLVPVFRTFINQII